MSTLPTDDRPLRPTGEAKALVKGLTIIDLLAERGTDLSLAEIALAADVPKATAHRLLATLVDRSLARSTGDGKYGLGARCLALGEAFVSGLDVRFEAHDAMRKIVDLTQETCHLGVLEGAQIVYIEKLDSPQPVRMHSRVGATNPASTTGLGQAILAFSRPEVVDAVFAEPIPQRTPNTIVDVDAARARLAAVHRSGIGFDDIENELGIRCVAAPILDHYGFAVAGLSVAGPAERMTSAAVESIGKIVREAATIVSRRFGYTGPVPGRVDR